MPNQENNKKNEVNPGVNWSEVHEKIKASIKPFGISAFSDTERNILILKNRAKKLAKPLEIKIKEEEITVIEFSMAYETYAIEYSFVREIYNLKEIVPVPCTPAFVIGITNVRGQIISVISLKNLFELPEKGLTDLNKIIILKDNDMEFGLLADTIIGMKKIPLSKLQHQLPTLTGIREKYLYGISSDKTIVLDALKLLTDKDIIIVNNKKEI